MLLDDGFWQICNKKSRYFTFWRKSPKTAFVSLRPFLDFRHFLPSSPTFVFMRAMILRRIVEGAYRRRVRANRYIKSKRLDAYLGDNVVGKYYFLDHYYFTKQDVDKITIAHPRATLLYTKRRGKAKRAWRLF